MSSDYCERSDIESIYGVENVAQWGDLDRDADAAKITNRISDAISDASDLIDDRFRDSQYLVPLTGTAGVPRIIKRICATMAGLMLHDARGAERINEQTGRPIDRYEGKRRWVHATINDYLSERSKLDATRETGAAGSPQVVL